MKGIIYKVTYCDGIMDMIHGNSYQTNVIHIPEIKAEINMETVREANDSYEEEINKVIPEKLGKVEISKKDANTIKIILKSKKLSKNLVEKYMDKIK